MKLLIVVLYNAQLPMILVVDRMSCPVSAPLARLIKNALTNSQLYERVLKSNASLSSSTRDFAIRRLREASKAFDNGTSLLPIRSLLLEGSHSRHDVFQS